ncbi:MAG: hypothetical protein ABEI99_08085 [Halobaculum sp.]
MLPASPQTLVTLGVVTAVGVAFAFFGYDLADQLLSWIGWLAGAGGGAAAGWFLLPTALPELTFQGRIVGAVLLVAVGAIVGRILIPLFSRFTVVIAGFVSTSGAVLVLLVGGQVTNAVANVSPGSSPTTVVSRLAGLPVFETQQFQQFAVIALVAGILGAVVASKFYQLIVTVAATGIGAALLGVVLPMWEQALSGGVSFGGGLGQISPLWFVATLVLGIGTQLYRHRQELDLPFLGDDGSVEALQ